MNIVKYIILFLIFSISCLIGKAKSDTYSKRVIELRQLENLFIQLKNKIKFTYKPLGEIFEELEKININPLKDFLIKIRENMEKYSFSISWKKAIKNNEWNINNEDKSILAELGYTLGKSDVEGQENEIELVIKFIEKQIEKAEYEKNKNSKIYKTLGKVIGLGIVIILI